MVLDFPSQVYPCINQARFYQSRFNQRIRALRVILNEEFVAEISPYIIIEVGGKIWARLLLLYLALGLTWLSMSQVSIW
jgi:hypothetical protein